MNVHTTSEIIEAMGIIWLTRSEAAKHARVSYKTVARWCSEGLEHSGGHTKGRRVMIRLDHLDEWITNHRNGDKPEPPG